MKKIISALLLMSLTLNVFAASASSKGLEVLMDEYQYAMSVEWDQKDQVFHEKQTQAFLSELAKLNMSSEDLLAVAEKKMGNKKQFEALKLKMSLLSKVNSEADLAKMISQNSHEFYSRGASWNGATVFNYAMVALIAGIIGYAIYRAIAYECVEWEYKYHCTGSNNDGNDWCGYGDVCVRSEKK